VLLRCAVEEAIDPGWDDDTNGGGDAVASGDHHVCTE